MSDPAIEWRFLYPSEDSPGRRTLFVNGKAQGDLYLTSGDVYRVRWWPPFRVQGGQEQFILGEAAAERELLAFVRSAWQTRRDEEDGA